VVLTAIVIAAATCKRLACSLTWRRVVVAAFLSSAIVTAAFIASASITIFTSRWAGCVAVDAAAIVLAITIARAIATATIVVAVIVAVSIARASAIST
jgi:hypothetical protein